MKRNTGVSDSTASSGFLMIAIAFVIAVVVMLAWHPWTAQPVNKVPTVTVTHSP